MIEDARLAPVLERSLVGFYVIQTDGEGVERFVYVNPRLAEMFGYEREEVVGLSPLDLVHDPDRSLISGHLADRFAGDVDSAHYEFRGRRKDGETIRVEVHGSRAVYEDATAVIGTLVDVTERRRAEEALRDSEERFRALIEGASDTVAILDEEGRVVYHSPSVTRMLGYRVDELVGEDPFEKIHPEDAPEVRARFADLLRRPRGSATIEYRHAHKDGGWRVLESVGRNLLDDPAIEGIVVNTRDVTEAKQLAERLRSAEKMEAIGQLAGGIAHDFNNILTVIQGHAQLLQERLDEASEGFEGVAEIRRSAERAATLTHQLLAFGRRQVVRPEVVDLGEVVYGSESMLRRLIGEDVEIVVEVADDLSPVRVDQGQIEQVVVNLVVNARDALPEGGSIRIEIFDEGVEEGDRRVVLRVADDGVGMDRETRARIFEPFFTTKDRGRGTGLGLATVYGIVQESDATIDVESRPGDGTVFEIRFPAVEGAPRPGASPRPDRTAGAGREILVIEDEAPVRRLAERILSREGYRVLTAESGEAALEAMDGRDRPVDLVLSDVVLPGMDGYRVAERLRERWADLRVVYMSGYMEDDVVRRGVASAADGFLAKPFPPPELLDQVAAALEISAES